MSQQPSILSFFQPAQPGPLTPPTRSTSAAPTEANEGNRTAESPVGPIESPLSILPFTSTLPPPHSLPVGASILPVADCHVAALRRINSLLLPIHYPDAFYKKLLDPAASQSVFSRVILWQDDGACAPKVIGGLVCRLEPNAFLDAAGRPQPLTHAFGRLAQGASSTYQQIYIQSLVLLSPYRARGLAAAALDHVLASAALMGQQEGCVRVRTAYAHVWTQNREALHWYDERGFVREGGEPVKGYYFKLRPDTAWIVRRDVEPAASAAMTTMTATLPPSRSTVAAAVTLPTDTAVVSRPGLPPSGLSYQNVRPDTEWNDLPAEMVSANEVSRSHLLPPDAPRSGTGSRSSSTARKKRDRAYPAGAFGV